MTNEPMDRDWLWALAASWARGQSFGPWAHGVDPEDAARIEVIRDLIVKYDSHDELSDQEILDLATRDLAFRVIEAPQSPRRTDERRSTP
jgi:hypothetical protein